MYVSDHVMSHRVLPLILPSDHIEERAQVFSPNFLSSSLSFLHSTRPRAIILTGARRCSSACSGSVDDACVVAAGINALLHVAARALLVARALYFIFLFVVCLCPLLSLCFPDFCRCRCVCGSACSDKLCLSIGGATGVLLPSHWPTHTHTTHTHTHTHTQTSLPFPNQPLRRIVLHVAIFLFVVFWSTLQHAAQRTA